MTTRLALLNGATLSLSDEVDTVSQALTDARGYFVALRTTEGQQVTVNVASVAYLTAQPADDENDQRLTSGLVE